MPSPDERRERVAVSRLALCQEPRLAPVSGRIGAGSVTLPGVTIHEDGLVAAGSTVTKDVPARTLVVGKPARVWRDVPVEQLLENQGWVDA